MITFKQFIVEDEERSILSVFGKQQDPHPKYFDCSGNKLTSLEGAPSTVNGEFWCARNNLTSLEGAPKIVHGQLNCDNNKLTSLHDIHKYIKQIDGTAFFNLNPIKECVLGLLMIDGLTDVALSNKRVQDIMDEHLAGDRDVFACQEELIEAGFPKFAKL